jgi:hypothetical protein
MVHSVKASIVLATVLLLAATELGAQSLDLQLQDGRVSLDARGVSLRQILERWATLTGATIVGGERVPDESLTLQLVDVPERTALDVVLRDVSGYVLAERQSARGSASTFDRILILPTSSAPRNAQPNAPRLQQLTPTEPPQPFSQGVPQVGLEPAEQELVDIAEGRPDPATLAPSREPGSAPQVPPARTGPDRASVPFSVAPQQEIVRQPGSASPQPVVPANPFGVTAGSAKPGTTTPPVRPPVS